MKTVSLVSAKVVAKAKVDATFAEITSEYCNLSALGFAAVEVACLLPFFLGSRRARK
jgi:hypothetical protein